MNNKLELYRYHYLGDEEDAEDIIESRHTSSELRVVLAGLWYDVATRWNLTIPKGWYWERMCDLYPWPVLMGALMEVWNKGVWNKGMCPTKTTGGEEYYARLVRQRHQELVESSGVPCPTRARRGSAPEGDSVPKRTAAEVNSALSAALAASFKEPKGARRKR